MSQSWVFDRESFFDFLGFVIHCAPDFPEEDYLEPHEQLDLESAFKELHRGLDIMRAQLSLENVAQTMALLDASMQRFRDGDDIGGTHALQELDRILFPRR